MKKSFFISIAALVALLSVFSCKKENAVAVESIMIVQDDIDLAVGQSRQLSVKVFPENATAPEIKWSSDKTNIASISETGLVKASPINEGSATITARCGDKEAHCTVKVTIPVKMFDFTSGLRSKSMAVGEVFEWSVIYTPPTATERENIVFENLDPSVAELKQDGSNPAQFTVTAKKLGNTIITAKCGGKETEMLVCVDEIKATKVTVNPSSITLDPLTTQQLTATVEPSTATNKRLFWYSMVPETATVDENGLVKAKRPGTVTIAVYCGEKYAYCNVTVTDKIPEGAVDLGLSVLWASCNLGASSPKDYGDYYAWGETQTYYKDGHSQDSPCSKWRDRKDPPITGYNWESYKFGQPVNFFRYNAGSSGPVILWDEDDVAHVKLGGHWRMPTAADFQELLDNCTPTLTTLGGNTGFQFTSNKTGYTDKWIFLPVAGYRRDTKKYKEGGHYWSSSLCTKYNGTISYILLLYPQDYHEVNCDERCLGLSVRPVCD